MKIGDKVLYIGSRRDFRGLCTIYEIDPLGSIKITQDEEDEDTYWCEQHNLISIEDKIVLKITRINGNQKRCFKVNEIVTIDIDDDFKVIGNLYGKWNHLLYDEKKILEALEEFYEYHIVSNRKPDVNPYESWCKKRIKFYERFLDRYQKELSELNKKKNKDIGRISKVSIMMHNTTIRIDTLNDVLVAMANYKLKEEQR